MASATSGSSTEPVVNSSNVTKLTLVHDEDLHTHVVFWIDVESKDGTSWTVKRRYSEFVELRQMLKKRFTECVFPSIKSSSKNPDHRRECLAEFVKYLSIFEEFLNCHEVCAFITDGEHVVASAFYATSKLDSLIEKLLRQRKVPSKTVELLPRKQHVEKMMMFPGFDMTYCWRFESKDFDVGFSIRCEETDEALVTYSRAQSHLHPVIGHATPTRPGTYHIIWDNTYSKFNKKTVTFQIYPLEASKWHSIVKLSGLENEAKAAAASAKLPEKPVLSARRESHSGITLLDKISDLLGVNKDATPGVDDDGQRLFPKSSEPPSSQNITCTACSKPIDMEAVAAAKKQGKFASNRFCSETCKAAFEIMAAKGTRLDLKKKEQAFQRSKSSTSLVDSQPSPNASTSSLRQLDAGAAPSILALDRHNVIDNAVRELVDERLKLDSLSQSWPRLAAGSTLEHNGLPWLSKHFFGTEALGRLWKCDFRNGTIWPLASTNAESSSRLHVPARDYVDKIISMAPKPTSVVKVEREKASGDASWGFEFEDKSGELVVARVDAKSKAFEAGIRPGQLFVEVNGSPCKTLAEFEKRVGSLILFEAKVRGRPTAAMKAQAAADAAQLRFYASKVTEATANAPTRLLRSKREADALKTIMRRLPRSRRWHARLLSRYATVRHRSLEQMAASRLVPSDGTHAAIPVTVATLVVVPLVHRQNFLTVSSRIESELESAPDQCGCLMWKCHALDGDGALSASECTAAALAESQQKIDSATSENMQQLSEHTSKPNFKFLIEERWASFADRIAAYHPKAESCSFARSSRNVHSLVSELLSCSTPLMSRSGVASVWDAAACSASGGDVAVQSVRQRYDDTIASVRLWTARQQVQEAHYSAAKTELREAKQQRDALKNFLQNHAKLATTLQATEQLRDRLNSAREVVEKLRQKREAVRDRLRGMQRKSLSELHGRLNGLKRIRDALIGRIEYQERLQDEECKQMEIHEVDVQEQTRQLLAHRDDQAKGKGKGGAAALNAMNSWLSDAAAASQSLLARSSAGADAGKRASPGSRSLGSPKLDAQRDAAVYKVVSKSGGLRLVEQGTIASSMFARPHKEHAFASVASSMAKPERHYPRSMRTQQFPAHFHSAPERATSVVLSSFGGATVESNDGSAVAAEDDLEMMAADETHADNDHFGAESGSSESDDDIDIEGDAIDTMKRDRMPSSPGSPGRKTSSPRSPQSPKAEKKMSIWEKLTQAKNKALAGIKESTEKLREKSDAAFRDIQQASKKTEKFFEDTGSRLKETFNANSPSGDGSPRSRSTNQSPRQSGLLRHRSTACSNCGSKPMFGLRWRCLDCPTKVDLCDFCYRTGAHANEGTHSTEGVASSKVSKAEQSKFEDAVVLAVVGGSKPKAKQLRQWLNNLRRSQTVEDLAKVLKKLELPDVTYETAIAFTLQVLSRVQRPGRLVVDVIAGQWRFLRHAPDAAKVPQRVVQQAASASPASPRNPDPSPADASSQDQADPVAALYERDPDITLANLHRSVRPENAASLNGHIVVTLRLTVRDFRESEAERRHKELKAAKRAEYEAARQKAIAAAQLQAKKTSVQEQTEPEKKNAEVASAETKTAASPSATPGEIIAATPLTSTDPAVREAVASSIEAERKVIEMEKEHFNDISDEESQSAEASATTPHNNDVQPTVEATKSPPTGERNQYFRHGRIVSSQELQLWKEHGLLPTPNLSKALSEFYSKVEPSKLSNVPQIVKVFGGDASKLQKMFNTLRERYGTVPALVDAPTSDRRSPGRSPRRSRKAAPAWASELSKCLLEFYNIFAPAKAGNVSDLVHGIVAASESTGDARFQVESLVTKLAEIYGTRPDFDVSSVPTKQAPKTVNAADGAAKLGMDISNFFAAAVGSAMSPKGKESPSKTPTKRDDKHQKGGSSRKARPPPPSPVVNKARTQPQTEKSSHTGETAGSTSSAPASATGTATSTDALPGKSHDASQSDLEVVGNTDDSTAKPTSMPKRPQPVLGNMGSVMKAEQEGQNFVESKSPSQSPAQAAVAPTTPAKKVGTTLPGTPTNDEPAKNSDVFASLNPLAQRSQQADDTTTSSSGKASTTDAVVAGDADSEFADLVAQNTPTKTAEDASSNAALDNLEAFFGGSSSTDASAPASASAAATAATATTAATAADASAASETEAKVVEADSTTDVLGDFFAVGQPQQPRLAPTSDLRQALVDYYSLFNKEKLANVDKIVAKFGSDTARLRRMFTQLQKLYGEVPAYTGFQ